MPTILDMLNGATLEECLILDAVRAAPWMYRIEGMRDGPGPHGDGPTILWGVACEEIQDGVFICPDGDGTTDVLRAARPGDAEPLGVASPTPRGITLAGESIAFLVMGTIAGVFVQRPEYAEVPDA